MIILRADNRVIITGAKYSYLVNNYVSGSSSITIANYDGFNVNDYVLVGNFGSETAEILKIKAVNSGALTFKDAGGVDTNTKYAHSESTKVTILPYNQVEFFYETTTVFTGLTSISGKIDISAGDWFTIFTDANNLTGYGFFTFYNATTATTSQASNAIPYGGFDGNTVKQTLDAFFSLLNNKELKLISNTDAMTWMNEAHSKVVNRLNLINTEYNSPIEQTLTIIAGTKEYLLPTNFSDLISIVDAQNLPIDFVPLSQVTAYTSGITRYYIRGKYIGFAPGPVVDGTFTYRYAAKAPVLSSYTDIIDLPSDAYYLIKDFMLYRAYQKLKYPNALEYLKMFNDSIGTMEMDSIKRSANLDSWGIAPYANV